ncbi:MAG: GntR family transcriptional regulator, partial [Aurantimonas coralicida]
MWRKCWRARSMELRRNGAGSGWLPAAGARCGPYPRGRSFHDGTRRMSLADTDFDAPLSRPALAVELTDRMRRMIMEGELQAGEKVPEKALTERFGVSRT